MPNLINTQHADVDFIIDILHYNTHIHISFLSWSSHRFDHRLEQIIKRRQSWLKQPPECVNDSKQHNRQNKSEFVRKDAECLPSTEFLPQLYSCYWLRVTKKYTSCSVETWQFIY